jgi:hypothetical protein
VARRDPKFYAATSGAKLTLSGPCACAGASHRADLATLQGADGRRAYIDIIDVMTFDERGLITSMRAFWSGRGPEGRPSPRPPGNRGVSAPASLLPPQNVVYFREPRGCSG